MKNSAMKNLSRYFLMTAIALSATTSLAEEKIVPVDKKHYKPIDLGTDPSTLPPLEKKKPRVSVSMDCKTQAGQTYRKGMPGYDGCLMESTKRGRINEREKALDTNNDGVVSP